MTDTSQEVNNALAEWPPKLAVCVGTVVLQDKKVLFIRQAEGQSLAGHGYSL